MRKRERTHVMHADRKSMSALCVTLYDTAHAGLLVVRAFCVYRRVLSSSLFVGTKLLQYALDICKKHPAINSIYLHVQVNNEQAIDFYKKFGFEIKETIPNYCIFYLFVVGCLRVCFNAQLRVTGCCARVTCP